MRVLGIETSCDETAAAVVEDGTRILSNVVVSQIDIHKAFGGVVPEVAARSHIETILPVVDEAVNLAAQSGKNSSRYTLSRNVHKDISSKRSADLPLPSDKSQPVQNSSQIGLDPWSDIDAIAVTTHPGLIGSLMIGTLTARILARVMNKPLYPIDHIEAHVYASFLDCHSELVSESNNIDASKARERLVGSRIHSTRSFGFGAGQGKSGMTGLEVPEFPILALVVSGGHTQIMLFRDHGDYEILGRTQDDAAGEAFDKVAKVLGLPYPGGPSIDAAAEHGDSTKYHFPIAKMDNPLNFSFSGLKTAVLRAVQTECGKSYDFPSSGLAGLLNEQQRNDFAASFQAAAVKALVDNMEQAYIKYQPKSVVVTGGVAASSELRRQMMERIPIAQFPARKFCTDNAAMVASNGYFKSRIESPIDPRDIEIAPTKRK